MISTEAGQGIDCATADDDTVVVTTIVAGSEPRRVRFRCDDTGGVIDHLKLGNYRVEALLGRSTETDIEPRSTEIVSLSNQGLYESGVDVRVDLIAFTAATSSGVSSSVEPR